MPMRLEDVSELASIHTASLVAHTQLDNRPHDGYNFAQRVRPKFESRGCSTGRRGAVA
jgi:hypothetical protein